MKLNDKDLLMIQNEFGDYEGRCPHCNEIFYLPIGWTSSMEKSIRQCKLCGGWVRLF